MLLQYNFVGRLLGPRGNSLKRVEANTECRVLIRGRGSIKDPARVILISSSIDNCFVLKLSFSPVNEELHLYVVHIINICCHMWTDELGLT